MYYEPYENERPRWWLYAAGGVALALILLVVFAFWQLRSGSGDAASGDGLAASTSITEETPTSSPTSNSPTTSSETTSTAADVAVTTTARTASNVSTETTDTVSTASSTPVTADSVASAPPVEGDSTLGYPTSPDGSPLPLVVVFDTDTITITGQVPSQAAKDRLAGLAVANSQFPDAELIDNMVINSAVPISVGVRVIELNSARFPEASAEILPQHAVELDRVAAIMEALPNISVLVVGHADQRGDDVSNFAISDERARSVVNYLLYLGISQTRLASRAAGASDLLTLENDDASFALNRRTEFIFSGLLIE